MKSYTDYEYKADEGKYFVLTELGKTECASYRHKEVGKPVDNDAYFQTFANKRSVENGYLVEVDDPDWVEMPGYRAVYDVKGDGKYIFNVGNPIVYPFKEQAEAAAKEFMSRPWNKGEKAWVIDDVYKGKRPKECREYNGKKVYNRDTWTYAFPVGSLVEEEVVDDAINCVPPVCMRSDCSQCGEPSGSRIDDKGNGKNTYETFKKIADGIWEYCGDCFRGENTQRGTEPVYV